MHVHVDARLKDAHGHEAPSPPPLLFDIIQKRTAFLTKCCYFYSNGRVR